MEAGAVPAESGDQSGEAPAQGPAIDLSPLEGRLGEIGQSVNQFNERLSAFESQLAPQEGEGEYDDSEYDFADPGMFPEGEGEMDPKAAQQWLESMIDKRAETLSQQQVQTAVEPLMQQLDDLMTERASQEILREFPEFGEEQRAEAFMDFVGSTIEELQVPDEIASKLVGSAPFLRIMARAARNQEAARNEQPATEAREHPLEPAGGANLGGGEPDPARSIVNARGGNSFWGT